MQIDAPRQDLRGVALLVRQGVAAWMRCGSESCARVASHGATAAQAAPCAAQRPPSAIDQMLVNIVAAMALSNVVEEISA